MEAQIAQSFILVADGQSTDISITLGRFPSLILLNSSVTKLLNVLRRLSDPRKTAIIRRSFSSLSGKISSSKIFMEHFLSSERFFSHF